MREIDPTIFGPGTWTVSHVLSLVCDENSRKQDYKFFALYAYRMIHALPCGECRKHAVIYLDKNPIPSSKIQGSLFEWTVTFHNTVNKRLKKSIMSLAEARDLYENTEVVLLNKKQSSSCSLKTGCEDSAL